MGKSVQKATPAQVAAKKSEKAEAGQMPNLANATPSFLVDELGALKRQISDLEKTEAFLKEALKARLKDQRTVVGEQFTMIITTVTQERIDPNKVRELLTPKQLEKVINAVTFDQMRFTRN